MNRILRILLRAGMSLGLLALLLSLIEFSAVAAAVNRIHVSTVLCCLLVSCAGVFLSVYKWQAFLKVGGSTQPYPKLIHIYMIGIFFNNFLPTSVGGDVVRTSLLYKDKNPLTGVMSSIFAERFFGLLAVCLYGAVGILTLPALAESISLPLLIMLACLVFFCLLLLLSKKKKWRWFFLTESLEKLLNGCCRGFLEYIDHPRTLVRAAWTSLVFQMLVGVNYYLVARDIQIRIDFWVMLVVVSLVTLMTLMPISLNGIGVRDGGFVFFLGHFGVAMSESLALSLSIYAIGLGFSLFGWVSFAMWKRQQSTSSSPELSKS